MSQKQKKVEIAISAFTIFSFVFLTPFVFAKEDSSVLVIKKIESAQREILRERYRQRLKDAKEYLKKGDRYYAAGKRLEALGEWCAAYALLDLLKSIDVDIGEQERTFLEQEVKSRLEVDKTKAGISERQRSKKMEEAVQKILEEQEKEKIALLDKQKQQIASRKAKKKDSPKVVSEKKATQVSLADLEQMKQDRMAVEEEISRQLGITKVKPETVSEAKQAQEAKIYAELEPSKEAGIDEKAKVREKREQRRLEKEEKAKIRQLQIQEEKEKRRQEAEVKLAKDKELKEIESNKKDEALKREIEAALSREKAVKSQPEIAPGISEEKQEAEAKMEIEKSTIDLEKELTLDEELRKESEEKIASERKRELEKSQDAKACTEEKRKKIISLPQDKDKQKCVDLKLKKLEKKHSHKRKAKEKIKVSKAKKLDKEESYFPNQELRVDRFDIIDRMLRRFEFFYIE